MPTNTAAFRTLQPAPGRWAGERPPKSETRCWSVVPKNQAEEIRTLDLLDGKQ
jgi:hypothetical protein